MSRIYDYQGNSVDVTTMFPDISPSIYDATVKGVAHRGFSTTAPENTLPAYRLAKTNGFYYVECDISFTSDGVPMLLHDATIDRTSNGSGKLSEMTYDQVRTYDFGSWKSSTYAGTVIPTFEEFIALCRNIGLHPYLELKQNGSYTKAQIQSLVDVVNDYGMRGKVSWISFSSAYLTYVRDYDEWARLGYIVNSVSLSDIATVKKLLTGINKVFVDSGSRTNAECLLCRNNNIPMETWTVDSESTIKAMNPYITGVTSNSLIAGQVLYNDGID